MTGLSAGSKTIYTVGTAVLRGGEGRAAADARDRRRASWRRPIHDLEIEDGTRRRPRHAGRSITLAQIGKKGNLYMSKVPPVLGVEPPGLHASRRRRSPPSSRGSRWTRTPAR